jgi:hypothetical protein
MRVLLYNSTIHLVGKEALKAELVSKPVLNFSYDELNYDEERGYSTKVDNGVQSQLSNSNINSISNFCDNYPYKIWKIEDGVCTDECTHGDWDGHFAHCPPPNMPGHFHYDNVKKNWEYVYGIDADGKYLGNVPYNECTYFATSPGPPMDYYRWNNETEQWYDARSFEELKISVLENIENSKNFTKSYGILYNSTVWSNKQEDIDELMINDLLTSWKDSEGNDVEFDGFALADIRQEVNEYNTALDTRFAEFVIQVNAAETKEELQALRM